MDYADEGIRGLDASLRATSVLSEDYRKSIMVYALSAVGDSFHRGRKQGRREAVDHLRANGWEGIASLLESSGFVSEGDGA